ncbi:MAG: hypothetical protein WBP77_14165, partial [Candidatus Sulfotelmatobacter sp.]
PTAEDGRVLGHGITPVSQKGHFITVSGEGLTQRDRRGGQEDNPNHNRERAGVDYSMEWFLAS